MSIAIEMSSLGARGSAHDQSPWGPLDLGLLLEAWHRADDATVDGNKIVTTYNDKSGNGYHLTQGGASGPVQDLTGGPNKTAILKFTDDTSRRLREGTMAPAAGWCTFTVLAFTTNHALGDCIHDADNSVNGFMFRVVGGAPDFEVGIRGSGTQVNASAPAGTIVQDEYNYYKCLFSATAPSIEKDGTVIASSGFDLTPTGVGYRIGQDGANGGLLNANMCESIVCNANVTGAKLASLEAYFASRYGS